MMAPMPEGGAEARSEPLRLFRAGPPRISDAGERALAWAAPRADRVADAAFALFLAAVALVRWTVVSPLAMPTGTDGGNWLALGRALGHGMPVPGGVVYPPLVPALALLGEWLGRPVGMMKYVAILSSLAPAAGCYLAARICGLRWRAALPCAFLAVAGSVGEAAAWGGYPQLLGLGLMAGALALLDRALRSWSPRAALLAGVALAASLSANELVGAVVVLAAAILAAIHLLAFGGRPAAPGRILAVLALAATPALVLLPTYWTLLVAIHATSAARPAFADSSLLDAVPFIYRDVPVFWYPVQVLAMAIPVVAVKRRGSGAWPLVAAILVAATVLFLGLHQVRFAYVLPLTGVLALAAWLDVLASSDVRRLRTASLVVAAVLVPLLAYQTGTGIRLFESQTRYYKVVPPDWVPALQFLRDDTDPGSLVAVGPDNRLDPTGWWVQGLAERPALISSDPAWLSFPGERARTAQARWIFDPSVTPAESLRRARELGVSYLVIDKRWKHYDAWAGESRFAVDEYDVAVIRV